MSKIVKRFKKCLLKYTECRKLFYVFLQNLFMHDIYNVNNISLIKSEVQKLALYYTSAMIDDYPS